MNREAFHKLSYGLYVVTSGVEGKSNGQIANTVFQVTSEPLAIAVSINKQNYTHELIRSCRRFAVTVLDEMTPMKMIGQFGFKCGRDINKFEGVNFIMGKTGVPVVTDHGIAFIEVEVADEMDCGTHTIFFGRVEASDILDGSSEPMTYAYYYKVKGGKSPPTAPTYRKDEFPTPAVPDNKGDCYTCRVCGYTYDPGKGDPEGKISPGISFQDLPAEWVCPVCGAGKDQFEKDT